MRITCLNILLIFTILAYSQESTIETLPRFQQLDFKDGLSNLNVSSIVQDKLGYIWIATARGLNRYDGSKFKCYLYDTTENSLFHDWVHKLHVCPDGNILCSTRYGLNLFDPYKDKMYRISSNNEFFLDFIDFKNNTYGVSVLKGLSVFNRNKKSFETIPLVSNNTLLYNIISDNNTGLWAIAENNRIVLAPLKNNSSKPASSEPSPHSTLVNFNPQSNSFTNYPLPESSSKYNPEALVRLDSILLIAGKKIISFNLNTLKFNPLPKKWDKLRNIVNMDVMFIDNIEKNTLWIGTRANGLFIFNLKSNELVNLNKSTSDLDANWPTCVFKDKDKNIWLGTFDHGVQIYFKDRSNFNFDHKLNQLCTGKFITSITGYAEQNYILGTRYNGYYIYDPKSKKYKQYNKSNSFLTTNHIRTTFTDSQNKIWVASENALHITDRYAHELKKFNLPKPHFGLVSFCEKEGKIIASSDAQGIFIFDLEGNFIKQELILGSNISQVISYRKDEVIAASYEKGIFIYNIKTGSYNNILNLNIPGARSLNQPITLHLDNSDNLWIGSYVSGLYKLNLNTNELINYTTENGLPNNDVVGIVEDRNGFLWLGTSYGLSRFDKKDEFVNFFYNEGLDNVQFHNKAAYIDKGGSIYFGGSIGISFFNPGSLTNIDYQSPPKIILESLTVQNKQITPDDETGILSYFPAYTKKIILNHNQNVFTIGYQAIDYASSKEIKYSYILEGLNTEWNKAGKRNFANFSNLNPGNYIFKVKAQNNKGIWSDVTSLQIKVKPSPFLTIPSFIIYTLVLLSIIYFSFHLVLQAKLYKNELESEHRERLREKEISQMKLRFFTNISHEIRTPLTLIKGNVDILAKELDTSKNKYQSFKGIQYSTNRLLILVNQFLSLRKMENDALGLQITKKDIVALTKELIQPYIYIAENRSITIETEFESPELNIPLDTDKYEKILNNLLSNSLKYTSENGKIKLKVDLPDKNITDTYFSSPSSPNSPGYVRISVTDNGSGIPQKDLAFIFDRYKQSGSHNMNTDYSGSGIGLNFTKRLIELHKGAIKVNSVEKLETCFSFLLPLKENLYTKENLLNTKNEEEIPNSLREDDQHTAKNRKDEDILILVVEDDQELNRYITSSLKKHYRAISAFDGKEGLLLAQNKMPQLIISDIMMPGIDGYELCRLIRKDEGISHIPIILLTAKTNDESKIEGFKYGADEYIAKPFDLELLIARINNLIQQRKTLRKYYKKGMFTEHTQNIENPFELNFVKRIETIVEKEYSSPGFNVNILAENMNMSRANFYRKFMSVMDISPKDFITKYRINKSLELMKNSNYNLGEISSMCGFGNQSKFSVLFKKEKGISPLDFKKSL